MALLQPIHSRECYRYAAEGRRVVKTHLSSVQASATRQQVRYLAGLEKRLTTPARGETTELRVVTVGNVRIHRDAAGQRTSARLQVRFSLNDRTGSTVTELDRWGRLLSRETYYPFGGTAVCEGKSAYKTRRYSGKERDATGLYYYGYRYYAPWLMRWLNTDPAGTVDGVNLYAMVKNSPAGMADVDGRMRRAAETKNEKDPALNAVDEPEQLTSSCSINLLKWMPDWRSGAATGGLADLSKKLSKINISAKRAEEQQKETLSRDACSPDVSDSILSKWTKGPLPDDNKGDFLYRGMPYDHPSVDKALNGIVEPANPEGALSTKNHNFGQSSRSQYTSWTREPAIAKKFATKNNKVDGIILRVKTGAPEKNESWSWVYSDDAYCESEVLLKGRRTTGIEVYTARPSSRKDNV